MGALLAESVRFIFNDAQEEAEQAKTCDKAEGFTSGSRPGANRRPGRKSWWIASRATPARATWIRRLTPCCATRRPVSRSSRGEGCQWKGPKLYKARELGELGEVDCAATVIKFARLRTWRSWIANLGRRYGGRKSKFANFARLRTWGSLALQSSSPDSPSSQTVNDRGPYELGFSDEPEEADI